MKKEDKGRWYVDNDGFIIHENPSYIIQREDIEKPDWILHLMGKNWVDLNSFMPVYFEALNKSGKKETTIQTHY